MRRRAKIVIFADNNRIFAACMVCLDSVPIGETRCHDVSSEYQACIAFTRKNLNYIRIMKKIIFSVVLAGVSLAASANATSSNAARWLRDVQISPDGKHVLFCYKGDIYKVGVAGGVATRLTTQPSYEATPLWSPDGKQIAFSSDRHGNFDVFVMPAEGGKAQRLTYNSVSEIPAAFTPDGKHVLFNAAIQQQSHSMVFPTGAQPQVYKVAVSGGRPVQILGTPAEAICFTPDGKQMLYQDRKGFEDEFRKHHTSSVTRDIWLYDTKTATHKNLTSRGGEDRNPVLSPDGKTVYFLSERNGGSFNVYSFPIDNAAAVSAVTTHTSHPVRFLSVSKDGTLCYAYDGDIYVRKAGEKSKKINVSITRDDIDDIVKLTPRAARSVAVSKDGKQIAFVYRGEIFVTVDKYATTRQITHTAAAESSPSFSDDGRTLVYSSYRDGRWQLYRATIERKEDPNFAHALSVKEERIAKSDLDRAYPEYSPDGKEIAFIENRNRLMVLNVKTGKVRQVTDGKQWMSRYGGFSYTWSPDGKWFALTFVGNKRDPYHDIGIVSAQGGKITNITESAYASNSPQWVMDGNAILFQNERYGMRNHASWGTEEDAFLVFTNQDAYDRYRLSEEDYKMLQEAEAANKKKAEAGGKKGGKKADADAAKKDGDKKGADAKAAEKKPLVIELDGIQDRIVRITPSSSDLISSAVTKDGEKLYFISSSIGRGAELWSVDLRKRESKMMQKLQGAGSMALGPDGKIYIVGSTIQRMDGKTGKLESITFTTDMKLDRAAEREFLLQFVRHEVGERFYEKNMHGVKWDALIDHYTQFLPHIANNYDFAEMLSEILGELNVSHTGGRYRRPAAAGDDATAQLGLFFDRTYAGEGMKVTEVLAGGPFDRKSSRVRPGDVVTAINGISLTKDTDIAELLNGQARKKVLVSFKDGKSETVIPISNAAQSELLYKRWVKRCEHIVDSVSGGRLGYVHLESMDDPSFRTAYSNMLGKYNLRDGCVIDTRWNGGGRLHEDIEILTSGKKYLTQVVRGVESCDMPSRRYIKPTIMVQCEANYSNAHGTPWVYKQMSIGRLVGAPVPGTMTSVNWVTTQDPSLVFGIPVVGYLLEDRKTYLENLQLEPDIYVLNAPEDITRGIDQQLITATKELLKEIDSKK